MADKPEYQWWNPYGAFSDPINKATIDAQIKQEDEEFLKLVRKPPERGLVNKNEPFNPFNEYALQNWDSETKRLAKWHRDKMKKKNWGDMGAKLYRDEYGDHSGELYEPATDEQIAAHLRFNYDWNQEHEWDGYDPKKIDQGIIIPEKHWTSGRDTWNALYGDGNEGATIDSQNSKDKKLSDMSTLAPNAQLATPPPPPKKSRREEKNVPIVVPKYGQEKFLNQLAWHESRNKPDAVNIRNKNKTKDVGWLQINETNLNFLNREWKTNLTLDDLKDKEINTMAYYLISNDNGRRFQIMFGKPMEKEDILVSHNKGLGNKKGWNRENGRGYLNTYYENEKGWAIEEKRIADEEAKAKAKAETEAKAAGKQKK